MRSVPKGLSSGGMSHDQPSSAWPPLRPDAAPGHAAGFQQRYTLAGLGQAQGGVQAAEAGANDQDFGVVAALQGRVQGMLAG